MCGIAGFVKTGSISVDVPSVLENFSNQLQHRGPDYTGFCTWKRGESFKISDCPHSIRNNIADPDVGLVHSRLSIIDTSSNGHQPMSSRDGHFVIVLNGEIYNYLELRQELEKKGYKFATNSDTEVLLNAYIEWSHDVFTKLVGMFAFCILDRIKNSLLIARDYFGIKPLFYSLTDHSLVFASEIKALMTFPGINRQADIGSVHDYLKFGLVNHTGNSFFDNVFSLSPGHYMEVSVDKPRQPEIKKYWELENKRLSAGEISFDEASRILREHFIESIMLHMRSDVPIGAALSGGIDSSAIVAAMRAVGGENIELHTFTYSAQNAVYDERYYADLVIKDTRANANKIYINANDLVHDLDKLIYHQDEPFGSTSIYAQYKVFQNARNSGIKVLLDGQGADELFAGYLPYYSAALAGFISSGNLNHACNLLMNLQRHGHLSVFNMLLRTFIRLAPENITRVLLKHYSQYRMRNTVNWNWFETRGIENNKIDVSGTKRNLQDTLYADFAKLNLPGLLRYEDRNSMAHSLESRVPFLTPSIVGFLYAIPEEYLISPKGVSKAIFRDAMRGLVPDTILDRKDKIGFQTPEQDWFFTLHGWIEETLNNDHFQSLPFIDTKAVKKTWAKVKHGSIPFSSIFWRYVNLSKWIELNNVRFE